MTRHVADRRETTGNSRLKRFAEIERAHGPEGSHPAAKALHGRPTDRSEASRMRQFARIDRGQTA